MMDFMDAIIAIGYAKNHGGGGGGEPAAYLKSVAVNGNTATFTKKDGSTVDFVVPVSKGSTTPTTSTVGLLGQLYLKEDNTGSKVYQLKSINTEVTPNTYNWEEIGAQALEYIELTGSDSSAGWHDGGTLTQDQADILLANELNYIWLNDMHRLDFRYRDDTNNLATYASSDAYKTHTIEVTLTTKAWRYKHEELATKANIDDEEAAREAIEAKIDPSASSSDKLLPASKIDAKIVAMSARTLYKDASQHPFATHAELTAATTFYNAAGTSVEVNANDTAFVQEDEDHDNKKTLYTAASLNPVVWGFVMDWTDNEIILNGSSKIGETISIYAPETFGEVGKVLIGNGEGNAPTWGNLSQANVQYFSHNIKMSWNNSQFINLMFIDANEKAYNVANYGSVNNAIEAVRASMVALGYNTTDHPCICATNAGGNVYTNSYADATKIYTWTGGGWQNISGVVNITDTSVTVGGIKGYTSGVGIEVNSSNVINATQHTKFYTGKIAAGATSFVQQLPNNYVYQSSNIYGSDKKKVLADVEYDTTLNKVTVSISAAISTDIDVIIFAINSVEGTLALTCPFPVGSVYTSIGSANPQAIWANTTWSQLADGQFLMNTTDDAKLNTLVEEELPNLKGSFEIQNLRNNSPVPRYASDAFSIESKTTPYKWALDYADTSAAIGSNAVKLNANDFNTVYKDDGKVRPKSLACKMWIRTT